jgi:ABC-type dipeptide/oligopeptide/nickel transport system permease component
MLRFVRTHVRWAGILTQVAGLVFGSNPVFWLGTFIFFFSYVWTVSIMEEMWLKIEEANEPKKETEEDEDKQGQ